MSPIILPAYRIADSRIFLIKNMPVNALEETLSYISDHFKYLGFEIQFKPLSHA
jgi:hypothetical protein